MMRETCRPADRILIFYRFPFRVEGYRGTDAIRKASNRKEPETKADARRYSLPTAFTRTTFDRIAVSEVAGKCEQKPIPT